MSERTGKKALVSVLLLCAFFIFGSCTGYDTSEFSEKIEANKLVESNVTLIKKTVDEDIFSISAGASGVLYDRVGSTYYLLTAYHVVKELDGDDSLYILFYDEKEYSGGGGIGQYYDHFPVGTVEYGDVKYDLAVVSFSAEREVRTVGLSSAPPSYGDKVAAIGNPADRGRNYISFGKITSKVPVPFGDEMDDVQYDVITHSAYVSEGSSGSMLVNENSELTGINLGGSVNGFGAFVKGMAMPVDRVTQFLEEYKENRQLKS